MKITRVKAHPMSMKLDKIYWTSRAPWGAYNTIVVEVETDEGIIGIGTINKTPLKDIAEITDALEPVIKGMDALAHEAVWDKIFNLTVPHIEEGQTNVTRPIFDQNKRSTGSRSRCIGTTRRAASAGLRLAPACRWPAAKARFILMPCATRLISAAFATCSGIARAPAA